jgi:ABC-2 type transport system ATP-binding protein
MDTLTRDEVLEGLLEQALETTILISSHELAEIEHFTTHIAFLDKGRLVLQESIESLLARFRQVHVTLSARKTLPSPCPSHWWSPQIEGHALHFIDSDYRDHQTLYQQLTAHFGAIQFEEFPMSLREISNALIRHLRQQGGSP